MKNSHRQSARVISVYLAGISTFISIFTFSCDNSSNSKQRGASARIDECVDDTSVSKGGKSSTASKQLALQGTVTGTGTGTGTATRTGTGTGTATGTSTGTGTTAKVNYSDHVKPIFDMVCANCHNTPPRKPFNSYSSVSGTAIRSEIMTRVGGGSATFPAMPPAATPQLSAEQKATLTKWQADGFLETATSKPPTTTPPPSPTPAPKPIENVKTAGDEEQDSDEEEDDTQDDEDDSSVKKSSKSSDAKKGCK